MSGGRRRRVLVTGASRGIGFAVARAFAGAGYATLVLAEGEEIHEAAARIAAGTDGEVEALRCDITDAEAVARTVASLDRLDVLVNNAGIERPTPVDGGPEVLSTFRRVLEVNVLGHFTVTRACLDRLEPGASVIFTASIWGRIGVAEFGAYCASKHAVLGLVRSLSRELGPRGIRVNAVCPGWVETDAAMASLRWMAARSGREEAELLAGIDTAQALPGLMKPADLAGLYLFLASEAAAAVTGQAIHVDRGEVQA